jgi:hypothetical protein
VTDTRHFCVLVGEKPLVKIELKIVWSNRLVTVRGLYYFTFNTPHIFAREIAY